ncbi:RraA family protein [Rhodococcus sp. NPDC057529]|uniref:RraA family protein n=1 Tax=Rhodococcus sp. NPDC057529 TaxID=3346158 RepID=UPI003672965F
MFIDAPADNCRVTQGGPRPDPAILAQLEPYPSANVGDAQDRLNIMSSTIKAQWPGARCVGVALTVHTREGDNLAIHRALDDAQPGDVLVINGHSDSNRAVFGDLLAEICLTKRVAGVVIDGTTRDRDPIAEMQLPLWATGVTPTGPTKNGPGIIGEPIACGGVVVETGDIIVADGDGVAVIKRDRLTTVVDRLAAVDEAENRIRARIREHAAAQEGALA